MNWGHKLILVFICFGMLMGFMVYRCSLVSVNLVSKEYYKDELAYQQVINGNARATKLSGPVILIANRQQLLIQLPPEMRSENVKGEILLYCPAIPENDRRITLKMNANAEQVIPFQVKGPGSYEVKVSWEADNIAYFSQQTLQVPQ